MTTQNQKILNSKFLGLILGPVFFITILAIPFNALTPDAWKVIAVAAWMVIWWSTEAIPIPATALLPIVLFPLLDIFSIAEATAPYANPIIFLFLGGFLLALAMERHKLHERIALNLIKLTGTRPGGIILGFMIATAFLSMWISNTATALMMLPIAISVIQLFYSDGKMDKAERYFALCLMLGIAYSANIGGMATIIGTPPNVVLVGIVQEMLGRQLSFSKWMLMGVPLMVVLLIATFFLMKIIYPYKAVGHLDHAKELIYERLRALGTPSTPEKLVLIIFSLTAFFWIFSAQINTFLPRPILNDTLIAMAGGLLMFSVPIDIKNYDFILHWKQTEKLPWGILLLFGGGLCLAGALEEVNIVGMIGEAVAAYQGIPYWLIILLLVTVVIFLTELMSNTALATIMIPVVLSIGQGLAIDPLLLAIPVALASSCAFMMPISTPPNAIVFASGHIKMRQMMRVGLILNIISVFIILFAAMTFVRWLY